MLDPRVNALGPLHVLVPTLAAPLVDKPAKFAIAPAPTIVIQVPMVGLPWKTA
jgi:hypothetical protein